MTVGAAPDTGAAAATSLPRILYVVHLIPYVPGPGGETRTFHLLRAVTRMARVTLVAVDGATSRADGVAITALCEDVHVVPPLPERPTPPAPSGRVAGGAVRLSRSARSLLRSDPFPVGWLNHAALHRIVSALLATRRFDLVVVEHTDAAVSLEGLLRVWGGPCVSMLHDALSLLEQRRQALRKERSGRRRPSLSGVLAVGRLRAVERRVLRSYTITVVVSDLDAAVLARLLAAASDRLRVLPNGVDLPYFAATMHLPLDPVTAARRGETVAFVGSLWYEPNVDGVVWFVEAVWPLVRARFPTARLLLAGRSPAPVVSALDGAHGVSVFPDVPDVRPYLAAAALVVVPLRLGSGTRLKILDALAAGLPVVATTLGAEGLALANERDLLLADDPEGLAAAILRLLDHPEEARTLAAQGRTVVERLYSWERIGANVQGLLGDLVRCDGDGQDVGEQSTRV